MLSLSDCVSAEPPSSASQPTSSQQAQQAGATATPVQPPPPGGLGPRGITPAPTLTPQQLLMKQLQVGGRGGG